MAAIDPQLFADLMDAAGKLNPVLEETANLLQAVADELQTLASTAVPQAQSAVGALAVSGAAMGQAFVAAAAAATAAVVSLGSAAAAAAAAMGAALGAAASSAAASQAALAAGLTQTQAMLSAAAAAMAKMAQQAAAAAAATRKLSEDAKKQETMFGQVKKGVNALSEAVRGMTLAFTTAGALSTAAILGMVQVANPGVMYQWKQVMTDLSGVLGAMFAPIVASVVPLIRSFVDWIWNLSPATKSFIAAMGAASAVVVASLGAVTAAIVVVNVALTAFNTLTGGIVLVVGLVVTALAGLAAGGVAIAGSMGYLNEVMASLGKIATWVQEVISAAWSAMWAVVGPIVNAFGLGLTAFWEQVQPVFGSLRDAAADIIATFQTLGLTLDGDLMALIEGVIVQAFKDLGDVLVIVADITERTLHRVAQAIIVVQAIISAGFQGMLLDFNGVMGEITRKLDEFEKNKAKARLELFKKEREGPKDKAPHFGTQSVTSGIAEAKELFWKASMQASAGAIDPQIKAVREVKDEVAEGNKILKQLADAFGVGRPIAGGVGP